MTELIREQVLTVLQNDWATYTERFYRLGPETQTTFLAKQGYTRLADILAHVVAWWEDGHRVIENLLTDPNFVSQEYDVDAFNAQAVAGARELDETTVLASFEAIRQRMVQLVRSLPEAAFEDKRIVERLHIEVIGHWSEHALVERQE